MGVGPGFSCTPTAAGLHDSYRETHPDPVTDPGNTWGGVAGSKGSPRRIDFAYVRPQAGKVELTTDAPTYGVGDPITVHWADGPANRWDWVGVYPAGAADPEKDNYLVWGYTGGHDAGALPPATEGELVLGREHQGKPWPLPPGRYVAHYLLTDQYVSVGSTTFTVR
jgi:hypothetical protein